MASRASSKSKALKTASRGASKATKASSKKSSKKPLTAAPKATPKRSIGKAKAKKTVKRPTSLARSATRKSAPPVETSPAARYHTVTPFLNLKGAGDAIEFYKRAFGAEERLRMPNADGSIMHAELTIGDSTIMVADASRAPESRSSIHLTVADCDALFERAVSAGGTEKMPPQDMFWGDRYGQVEDPFGNLWSIATHKEDVPPEELSRRAAAALTPPPADAVTVE